MAKKIKKPSKPSKAKKNIKKIVKKSAKKISPKVLKKVKVIKPKNKKPEKKITPKKSVSKNKVEVKKITPTKKKNVEKKPEPKKMKKQIVKPEIVKNNPKQVAKTIVKPLSIEKEVKPIYSDNEEKSPVFVLKTSPLYQDNKPKTNFFIPSYPNAKITEEENKNSIEKSKKIKQINETKTNNSKKMNIPEQKITIKKDKSGKIILPDDYKPVENEKYMNPLQLEYSKRKLQNWKKDLLSESNLTIEHLMEESWNEPDPSDQATIVEQTGLELRTRDRYRKLISKIDAALHRIEEGEYGFCEVTGDPIGIARLEARPIATMTIAAQEQHELEEKLSLED